MLRRGKIIIFICGKSIVVFHCFSLLVARLLQSAVHKHADRQKVVGGKCKTTNFHNPAIREANVTINKYDSSFVTIQQKFPCV